MTAAFRTGPVPPAGDVDTIAVHCSDPRYQPHFARFLEGTYGAGRSSVLAVPGGPHFLTLTEYLPKFSWAGWRWMRFLSDLKAPRRVVLIAHADCRWYLDGRFAHGPADLVTRQRHDLERVRAAIHERFEGVDVETYFATLEGDSATFEPAL